MSLQVKLQKPPRAAADGNGMRGDLMQKALNYLKSFWDQLILYLKDGRYCIDRSALPLGSSKNSLAERMLCPMIVERKNSQTFGSHAGAKVSGYLSYVYRNVQDVWRIHTGVFYSEYILGK